MASLNKQTIVNKDSNSNWFLNVSVASVTIYFNQKSEDPFNTPKLILLLIISGWFFGHLINSFKENPISLKKKEFITILIPILFLLTLLFSAMFTDIQYVAFIGDTQRRNGFLNYFGLTIIFLYLVRSVNFKFSISIIKTAIVTGLLLSAYGFMQIMGNDFVKWNNPYNSMIGTVGNPNFASALLAVLSLIAIGSIFVKQISNFYKFISIIVLVLSIFSIIKSQSRQGLVTILFAMLFCVSIISYLYLKRFKYVVISISVLLSMLSVFGMLQKGPLSAILYKDSVSIRGYYWRAALEMLQFKPFTGIGIDRYNVYFKEFRDVSYPLKYGFEISSSNAHNTILQLFATGGIFVGLSYLVLLTCIFVNGLKLVKATQGDQQRIALTLLTAWVGFQAQSLISIDNVGISIWGWVLGGSILGLKHFLDNKNQSNHSINKRNKIISINLFQPLISVLLLIPIVIISSFLYRSESDMYQVRSFSNSITDTDKNILREHTINLMKNPLADPFYKLRASLALHDAGFVDESYAEINNLVKADPRNLDNLQSIVYLQLSSGKNIEAIDNMVEISKYDPWNAQNFLRLGQTYLELGEVEKAKITFAKILTFAPNSEQGKLAKLNLDKL
jgi:O-antigen ligase